MEVYREALDHSAEFNRQVFWQSEGGDFPYGLAQRHEPSRNLIQ
jgi:hypothetical protein